MSSCKNGLEKSEGKALNKVLNKAGKKETVIRSINMSFSSIYFAKQMSILRAIGTTIKVVAFLCHHSGSKNADFSKKGSFILCIIRCEYILAHFGTLENSFYLLCYSGMLEAKCLT